VKQVSFYLFYLGCATWVFQSHLHPYLNSTLEQNKHRKLGTYTPSIGTRHDAGIQRQGIA